MKNDKINFEEDFYEWLHTSVNPSKARKINENIDSISNILVEKKALKLPLMETTKIGSVENAIRQVENYNTFDFIREEAILILSSYLKFLRYRKHSLSKNKNQHKQNQIASKNWVPSNKPYVEQYDFDLNLYENFKIESSMFSTRSYHCLMRGDIKTVARLLEYSSEKLLEIKNCGKGTVLEIEAFIQTLIDQPELYIDNIKSSLINNDIEIKCNTSTSKLNKYINEMYDGDFSFISKEDWTQEQLLLIRKLEEAFNILGKDIINKFRKTDQVINYWQLLKDIECSLDRCSLIRAALSKIPKDRQKCKAQGFIWAYIVDNNIRDELLSLYESSNSELSSIQYSPAAINGNHFSLAYDFLNWCSFDLDLELSQCLEKLLENERSVAVLKARSQSKTLQEIGESLGITRERVRQIEAKARRFFYNWQLQHKLLLKISALRNNDTVLTPAELGEYFGDYTDLLLYLLKDKNGSSQYFYDANLDVFIVGDDSLSNQTALCMESMPGFFHISELEVLLEKKGEEFGLNEEILRIAIDEEYTLTGDTYHRSRLKLTEIYKVILEKYFAGGMHVYDENEINRFRDYIYADFGDISLPQNNRAIYARIAEIGILCDKGTYRPKRKHYISEKLAQKIFNYIDKSEYSVFLTNTVYAIFEDELRAEGVYNKYYLQGILHELYGDKLDFRRDYILKEDSSSSNVYLDIVNYIKKSSYLVDKNDIRTEFPGMSDIVINFAISDENILNFYGQYLHVRNLSLTDYDKTYLKQAINNLLKTSPNLHCGDLYEQINRENSNLLTKNSIYLAFSLFSMLEYLFKNEYQFKRPYIAHKGVLIERATERMSEFIFSSDEVNISDLLDFAKECRYQIQDQLVFFNSWNETHLLANKDTLMSITLLGVNEKIAKNVEDLICNEITDTSLIRNLKCIRKFPSISVAWNEWLIYSVLKKWSTRLEVTPSYLYFRQSLPVVSPKGQVNQQYIDKLRPQSQLEMTNNPVVEIDDLDNIDDLIADYILDY